MLRYRQSCCCTARVSIIPPGRCTAAGSPITAIMCWRPICRATAVRKARRFLMAAKGLSEDEAISLMSVAVDFGITQVADGNWGVHALIRKALFPENTDPFLVSALQV